MDFKNALGENLTFGVGPLVAKTALFAIQTAFLSPSHSLF